MAHKERVDALPGPRYFNKISCSRKRGFKMDSSAALQTGKLMPRRSPARKSSCLRLELKLLTAQLPLLSPSRRSLLRLPL